MKANSGGPNAALDLAGTHNDHINSANSETIIGFGLHEFLLDLIARNSKLSAQIETSYRFQP
jgi:uncharacterized alpha-E superfamily protein